MVNGSKPQIYLAFFWALQLGPRRDKWFVRLICRDLPCAQTPARHRRDDAAAAVDCLASRIVILEVVMLAPADALPLAVERAGEPQWRQAVARSVQDRFIASGN